MTNSRTKGKNGELEFSNLLKEDGFDARRGVQYHGGPDSPDVIGLPGIHVEVKRVERLNIHSAMDQSRNESGDDEMPIVAHRKNRTPWLVTMDYKDWIKMYRSWIKEECE